MSTCLIEKPTKVYFIIFSLTKILITSTFFLRDPLSTTLRLPIIIGA
jgi:hypothetical protein